jgi:hypothetical protein
MWRKGIAVIDDDIVAGFRARASYGESTAHAESLRKNLPENAAQSDLELNTQLKVVLCTDFVKPTVEPLSHASKVVMIHKRRWRTVCIGIPTLLLVSPVL